MGKATAPGPTFEGDVYEVGRLFFVTGSADHLTGSVSRMIPRGFSFAKTCRNEGMNEGMNIPISPLLWCENCENPGNPGARIFGRPMSAIFFY